MARKESGNLLRLVAALAILLLALALRLYRIEFQSLWWDEGVSLYLAGLDLRSLTAAKDFVVDLHPPLYHALLLAWTGAFGSAVFTARLLSATCGTLLVAATIALGRQYAGWVAGLVAGFLVAVSPFQVFYSQESRMYSLVPLLGVLSTLLVGRFLRQGRLDLSTGVAIAVVHLAALYTYYYLGLLVIAENLAVFAALAFAADRAERVRFAGRRSAVAGRWLAVQTVTALGFAPWLFVLARAAAAGGSIGIPATDAVSYSALGFPRETLLAFVVGFSRIPVWSTVATSATLALAAFGLAGRWRRAQSWLLVAGIAVPLALAYAVLLARPFYYPRFVIYAAPLLAVLAGAGVARLVAPLGRVGFARTSPSPHDRIAAGLASALGVGLLALALWPTVPSLRAHYTALRDAYSSADYRVALADLAARAEPGDLVLGTYPWQLGYLRGYLPNAGLATALASSTTGRDIAPPSAGSVAESRVWLLLYSPDRAWGANRAEDDLRGRLPLAFFDQKGDSRVELFAASPKPAAGAPLARLGDRVALADARVTPEGSIQPGAVISLGLTWQALAAPGADYTVFTHVVGPDGKVYAQHDAPPTGGAWPTGKWQAGAVVVDRHELRLAPDAPPGAYLVEVGMYSPATGARLPVGRSAEEADRVIVGRLTVGR